MSAAKEAILAAIKCRGGDREQEYAAIPRQYRSTSSLDRAGLLEMLTDRLHDYDAVVYRCDAGSIGATLGQALAARQKTSLVVAAGVPQEWLTAPVEFVRDASLSYDELNHCSGVLTSCAVVVALTGSIVLAHSAPEGRRALTLIPDYHVCVVYASQVVETVPEAVRCVHELHPTLVTTISGPSATADIEMTRIKGVHGPRFLDVVLVDGD